MKNPTRVPNLYISQREIAITYFLAGVAFNNPQIKGKPRRGARETTNDTRHCHYYPCISWCIGTNGVPVGAAGTKHNVSRGRNRLGWIGRGGEGKGCPKTRATHAWLNTHTRLALRGLNISMKAVGSGKQLESIILSNCINPHSFRQRWTRGANKRRTLCVNIFYHVSGERWLFFCIFSPSLKKPI